MMLALILQQIAETPWWAGLGIGGILAGVIAHFYRQDRKDAEIRFERMMVEQQAERERSDERLHAVIQQYQDDRQDILKLFSTLHQVLVQSAKATGELSHVLRGRPCLLDAEAQIRKLTAVQRGEQHESD